MRATSSCSRRRRASFATSRTSSSPIMVSSSCDGPQKRDGYTTPAIQEGQEKGPAGCASRRAPSERTRASGDGPYRGCLEPLVALGDLELHPLPLGQRLVAVHGDLGVVHEQVVTVFPFDEAVPLLVAEPLHGPLRHSDTLLRKNLVLALRPTEPPMRRRTHALSLHHASGAVNERLHSAVPGNSRRRISSHRPNRDSSSTPSGSRSFWTASPSVMATIREARPRRRASVSAPAPPMPPA